MIPLCPGSADFYVGLRNCACELGDGKCNVACTASVCSNEAGTQSCLDCMQSFCPTLYTSCAADL